MPGTLTAWPLLHLATVSSAQLTRRGEQTGAPPVRKSATVVALRCSTPLAAVAPAATSATACGPSGRSEYRHWRSRARTIIIDPRSAVPPFEHVRVQVPGLIMNGRLTSQARLPTVGTLAADLAVGPNTVARAYRQLEVNGAIETRGRHGTFVAERHDAQDAARKAAREFVAQIRSLRLSDDDAVTPLQTPLKVMGPAARQDWVLPGPGHRDPGFTGGSSLGSKDPICAEGKPGTMEVGQRSVPT